ncbi:hypothetical protein VTN77DRAFT_5496 [Rasamsonia byssochlamydoides]|uniref:uncharacterized protein n=1 Tax=Rasamsonia byssochlamydoides TaxID=89139 RepID=UPI0037432222
MTKDVIVVDPNYIKYDENTSSVRDMIEDITMDWLMNYNDFKDDDLFHPAYHNFEDNDQLERHRYIKHEEREDPDPSGTTTWSWDLNLYMSILVEFQRSTLKLLNLLFFESQPFESNLRHAVPKQEDETFDSYEEVAHKAAYRFPDHKLVLSSNIRNPGQIDANKFLDDVLERVCRFAQKQDPHRYGDC